MLANVEPGNGSRYGGGGVRGFDDTDISSGVSMTMAVALPLLKLLPFVQLLAELLPLLLLVELDSLSGFTFGEPGEWYSEDIRIRRSRRHLVVGNSLLIRRVSAKKKYHILIKLKSFEDILKLVFSYVYLEANVCSRRH